MDNLILFKNLNFYYTDDNIIFNNFNLSLPKGILSIIGPNGIGKSTLLLLASARILPRSGKVIIENKNTRSYFENAILKNEELRNRDISFIFQNLEFEDNNKVAYLLELIVNVEDNLKKEFIKELEIITLLDKNINTLSKGELQKVIILFALSYDSKIIMMDEPVFALENKDKIKIFKYLYNYIKNTNKSLYFTMHDLHITKKYSDYTLLMRNQDNYFLSKTKDILDENIEKIYNIPISLINDKERLINENLINKFKI